MNAADLLLSVVAGALVVVSGGLYALLLAIARLRASKILERLSIAAYLALVVCALVLAESLALSAVWYAVIAVMLLGYWLAPKAIWHLTVATHASETER
jgi:hypothetical protein